MVLFGAARNRTAVRMASNAQGNGQRFCGYEAGLCCLAMV
ncbi:hypothetical protein THTE_1667 [Thermogutta terrifontis]|uniref:Uncharacterized protein n=1 Tax=Thermogutta terrifontis TaxID=1331910 RepID=A0A286RE76_9BACT|nr:hypothetical protein THTE_1667 [Thermogutta terrifontis]